MHWNPARNPVTVGQVIPFLLFQIRFRIGFDIITSLPASTYIAGVLTSAHSLQQNSPWASYRGPFLLLYQLIMLPRRLWPLLLCSWTLLYTDMGCPLAIRMNRFRRFFPNGHVPRDRSPSRFPMHPSSPDLATNITNASGPNSGLGLRPDPNQSTSWLRI
ncbi:hypothetical protein BDN72DRAFT_940063 [Pluteus cervinus]|uniref:Uncharacterized protein n=1 Tax=Pluteus cervinus TaxID=181527 RepID=A0ACD3AY76_9AGAR|nr:hypothetical protein BDN72DRAFT_940063 [Pluteus cervinus]